MITERAAFNYLLRNPEGPFPADVLETLNRMRVFERDEEHTNHQQVEHDEEG